MADAGCIGRGQRALMNMSSAYAAATTTFAPLRVWVHVLVGVAIGLISPFTALAWPFAILVGMLTGSADVRRQRGEGSGDTFGRGLAVAIGVLAMLFFGAIIGGVIAFGVVALVSFSERAAAYASPTDRGVARILVFIVPIAMWLIVFPLLGVNVDVRIGG